MLVTSWSLRGFVGLFRGEDTGGTPRTVVWIGSVGSLIFAAVAWAVALGVLDPNG